MVEGGNGMRIQQIMDVTYEEAIDEANKILKEGGKILNIVGSGDEQLRIYVVIEAEESVFQKYFSYYPQS